MKGWGAHGEVVDSVEGRAHVSVLHGQRGRQPMEMPNEGLNHCTHGWGHRYEVHGRYRGQMLGRMVLGEPIADGLKVVKERSDSQEQESGILEGASRGYVT